MAYADETDEDDNSELFAKKCGSCRRWLVARVRDRPWDYDVGLRCTCYASDGVTQIGDKVYLNDASRSLRKALREKGLI